MFSSRFQLFYHVCSPDFNYGSSTFQKLDQVICSPDFNRPVFCLPTPLKATHNSPTTSPPPLLFSKSSQDLHSKISPQEGRNHNHYYQLQEWDNLLAALDSNKWKTNLTKLIHTPAELTPRLIYSDGYIIEHLDSSDTFTIAVQKCYARKAQIFGPRTVDEQLKMLSVLSKSNNGRIWVILVPIKHSKKLHMPMVTFYPPTYLMNKTLVFN
jgi:hypothetical protein